MIITNKIKVEFNKKNIDKDFDIYKISTEEKGVFYKTNVLDIAKTDFKAVSVVYTWGNNSYAMFKKGEVDKDKLKEAINNEVVNMQIQKIDIINEKIFDNVLTLLMLNSLNITKTDGKYNNLTGKLYFINKDWYKKDKEKKINGFYALELKLNNDMDLTLEVKTFGRINCFKDAKSLAMTRYIFDKDTCELRKKLKSDKVNEEECFINKSTYSKVHNTVPFLDFKSYRNYKKCKIGILDEFLQDVEEYLSNYIKIENCIVEDYSEYKGKDGDFENRNYSELLKEKKIIIVDEVKNDDSKKLSALISEILVDKYKIILQKSDEIDYESYNLKIIHGAEYYEINNLEDPYKNAPTDCVIQHITLESFIKNLENNKIEKAVVGKIIQELIIKGDILNRKISIVDWKKCNYEEEWTFLKRKQIQIDKENYKYIYCKMTILKDGTLDITIHDSSVMDDDKWEWNAIVDSYGGELKYKKEDSVEGIFYKTYENINRIYKTDKTTIPNFKALRSLLKKANKNEKISVSDIIKSLDSFNSDNKRIMEHKEEFIKKLKEFSEYETIGKINKEMRIRTKGGNAINKHIFSELNILINPELKTGDRKFELFGPMSGIKYYNKDNDVYYFVGVKPKNIKQSFRNACAIRKVVADETNEFESIVNLLEVEFVKNGQYTVVPFPFKYINEVLEKL
ncbi:MAG: hypothetical protein KIA08_03650 [Clostridium baratii]|uniref:hypothetical protein n=1 Tax=Clostridium baratii TaxID=1561 RepID=UPI00242BAB7E|nr:hypothetical protein [Clostridium baratii]MBS6041769.1 hypothetical protein [Clostridium baratii]